jgi:hypothetical protein
MGLGDFSSDEAWQFSKDANDDLVEIIDRHIPQGWKKNPDHRRQVYRVVEAFLKTPGGFDTEEREKRARSKVLEAEDNVNTGRTIADATGRRLYSRKPYREAFRQDLEQIERDYTVE